MPFEYLPDDLLSGGLAAHEGDSEALLQKLDADLAEQGRKYKALQDAADAAKKAYDDAKAPADALKTELQKAAIARYHLTGEKTHGAFQAATEATVTYDASQFLLWVLNAPRALQTQLLKLDTDATRRWLLGRYDDKEQTFRQLEECAPFMAVHGTKMTGKILSKELDKLPPIKMIETVTPLPSLVHVGDLNPTSPEAFLTVQAVADQIYGNLGQTPEKAREPVTDYVPPPDNDIPF